MNHPITSDERFVLAHRLRRIAAEIRALGDDLLRLPADADHAIGPHAADQHTLGRFLESQCQRTPGAEIGSLNLYSAYRAWVGQTGEEPMSHTMFAILLEQRGFQKYRTRIGVIYPGLGLRKGESAEVFDGR